MSQRREEDRRRAIERHLDGEGPAAIAAGLGYSRAWFYKWWHRYVVGDAEWFRERSRRPHQTPTRISAGLESLVTTVRQGLAAAELFCGAQAIQWELAERRVAPLPSVRTIGRILARHDLIERRRGRYVPKGKRYPALPGSRPGLVHQTDMVGPRYLHGPVRFYSLNSVEIATNRCAIEPLLARGRQHTINAFWATWCRLGVPRHQQVDNEMLFYGSPAHPRGMGSLIRLCLHQDIEPWFIPLGEPWRNGVVEKFNDHWQQKVLRRSELPSATALRHACRRFEARHNTCYRYSKLGGQTPLAALAASQVRLRFPPSPEPPRYPLPKPDRGRYHLIRFVRSDGLLDVFTEKFRAPPEAIYEYVRLTIDVEHQRLIVALEGTQIDEHAYRLR